MDTVCGRLASLSSHGVTLELAAPLNSTSLRKLLLDLSLLFAGLWPNNGWRSSAVWRCRSFVLATLCRISGSAIHDSIYGLSTGVGLRHPVTRRQLGMHTQQLSSRVLRQLSIRYLGWHPNLFQWACWQCCFLQRLWPLSSRRGSWRN